MAQAFFPAPFTLPQHRQSQLRDLLLQRRHLGLQVGELLLEITFWSLLGGKRGAGPSSGVLWCGSQRSGLGEREIGGSRRDRDRKLLRQQATMQIG